MSTTRLVTEIVEHRRSSFPDDEVAWSPRANTQVSCDKDAVRVVLENLLDNARKYGGGRVELTDSMRGARWRLEVKDAGQGFAPGDTERLFEPFERQLARQMRGELTAASPGPGHGAVFALELPLAREAARG